MRRRLMALTALFLSMLIIIRPTFAQTRSVFWEEWNVEIDNVDTINNSFDVRERYNLSFYGTFSFGSAVIPNQYLEAISDVQVYEAGMPLQASCSERPGTFCVTNVQEGTSVVYYFNNSLTNSRQIFELHYTVAGALRVYEEGDQIWWTAIPEEHFGFPIGQATVTVQLPSGFAPREGVDPVVTYGVPADINVNGSRIVARATQQLGGSDWLEIRVQYPHDPNARKPSWQHDFDDHRDFEENVKPLLDLGLIALGLLLAIGGPLAIFALWHTRGRDPDVGPVPMYLSELPDNLPPAVVGTLVDEKADLRDVLSTLIDLGRRGYLVIEEERKSGLFGIGGGSEFTFKRTDKPVEGLRPFEMRIINKVFANKLERSLDSLKNKFYQYIPQLQDDLYDELVNEGLFTSKPSKTRAFYTGLGSAVLFGSIGLGFLLASQIENLSGTLLCVPVALAVTGITISIIGQYMPAKTRKGAEETTKWNAFREYLRNLEKYGNVGDAAGKFDVFLPYAIAFGIDRSWIRRISKVPNTSVPIWYYPTYRGGYYRRGYQAGTPLSRNREGLPSAGDVLPGDLAHAGGGGVSLDSLSDGLAGGLESISEGLTNMLNSASRVLTSRPSSASSGSSGSWRSGGSSWSGGGSFGGGSSGGGSRGFG